MKKLKHIKLFEEYEDDDDIENYLDDDEKTYLDDLEASYDGKRYTNEEGYSTTLINREFELDVKYTLDGWKYRIENKKDLDKLNYSTYNDGNKKISFYDTPVYQDYATTILLINNEVVGYCYYNLQNRKGKKVYMISKITIDPKHRRNGYSLLIQKHISEIFPEYDFFYTGLNMSALGELTFKKNKNYVKHI